ncbi:MAG: PilZ domain-containing protein [Candidatus Omnitrophica bacterium]|nr:PilZ domain-containing protein [Candidatus Omnitrophota bacterium]
MPGISSGQKDASMDADNVFYYDYQRGEKRRFLRVKSHYVINYYVYPGHEHRSDSSITQDISVGGICFATDKHYPPGTLLHITLRILKLEHPLVFVGEVVYVRKEARKSFSFDIGVKFVEASEHDLYVMENIIRDEQRPHEKR